MPDKVARGLMIPNYEILGKIAEGPHSIVYRAHHKKRPERPLALKLLKVPLSERRLAHFRQRIEHLRVLQSAAVITPLTFTAQDGQCFLTQDYFEGVTLDEVRHRTPRVALADFFTIACRLARALDEVHHTGIVHGGVKPHNILVASETLDLRLIDFISTLDVRDVSHFVFHRSFVRHTLPYTSPEQTGRISHRFLTSCRRLLGVVLDDARRLAGVADAPTLLARVDDLLDLIAIEAGTVALKRERVDTAQITARALDALRTDAARRSLRVIEEPAGGEHARPTEIVTDPRVLAKILTRLTTAVMEFTDKVRVRLDLVDEQGGTATLTTIGLIGGGYDRGDEQRRRLVELFNHVERQGLNPSNDAGLGLYLAQRLSQLIGGTLRLEDHYGGFPTLTLTLPPAAA